MDSFFGLDLGGTNCKPRPEVIVTTIDEFFDSSEITSKALKYDSNVKNITFYPLSGCRLLLSIKHPAVLYFRGILGVKCLAGSVEIDGFVLKPNHKKDCIIASLASHSASSFNALPCEITLTVELSNELTDLNISNEVRDDLFDDDNIPSCLLLLWREESLGLSKLNSQLRNHLLPKRRSYGGSAIFSDFEEFTNSVFDISSGYRIPKKLSFPKQFKDFGQKLLNYSVPRAMFCGGKGVGKSTSIRYITNQLLSKWGEVLFLDFDIGQPEFTVPGSVSVHLITEPFFGPSFTHLRSPLKSIFLGFVSPDLCFNNYRAAVELLREYCSGIRELQSLPCVINTMGYVKGCGLLIINDIISTFNLTHVVELRSTNELHINFARPPTADTVMDSIDNCPPLRYKLETFQYSTKFQKSSINPKASRELMTFFYFIGSGSGVLNNLRTQTIQIQHEGTSEGRPFISLIENFDTLQRGEIVAVCISDLVGDSVIYEPLGFGKVVSYSDYQLSLLTPLPEDVFESCTIVRGDLSLRNDFFNENLPDGTLEPYENKHQIILTSGAKRLCPALFSA